MAKAAVKPEEKPVEKLKIKLKYVGPGGVNYNRFGKSITAREETVEVGKYFKAENQGRQNTIVARLIKDENVKVEILTPGRKEAIEKIAEGIAFCREVIDKDS